MSIPVVNMKDYADPARQGAFIQTLGRGLQEFGFVAVLGHGVDPELIEGGYQVARELFGLPVGTKRRYETPENGRQRGYTSFGVEHAKDVDIPDLKEFWHVGRELDADHPLRISGDVPVNQFPEELPIFGEVFRQLFDEMELFANHLLDAFGVYLGQQPGYFRDLVRDGNSVMRIIHYPDMGDGTLGGAVRAAAHEDINLITVLPYSSNPGLQVMTRKGEWMDVTTPPDVMIVDTGDMMKHLTGGQIPATTHRVVNPMDGSDGGRLSMPFFLHPHPDKALAPFTGDGESVTGREFLFRRLREIGVA